MTPDEFLDRQEAQIRSSMIRATRRTGEAIERVVDLPGWVRRRPALTLGVGAAAGFLVGGTLMSSSRHVTRRAVRTVAAPLLKPTLSGLGTVLAGILVGSAPHE